MNQRFGVHGSHLHGNRAADADVAAAVARAADGRHVAGDGRSRFHIAGAGNGSFDIGPVLAVRHRHGNTGAQAGLDGCFRRAGFKFRPEGDFRVLADIIRHYKRIDAGALAGCEHFRGIPVRVGNHSLQGAVLELVTVLGFDRHLHRLVLVRPGSHGFNGTVGHIRF